MTTMICRCTRIALLAALLNGSAQRATAQDVDTPSAAITRAAVSHRYSVYYRCSSHGWRLYGCYDCPITARQIADMLESRGYEVKIVCDYEGGD
jgi:hypothetical protein